MNLDERLTMAAHGVVEQLPTPTVDLEGIRTRARRERRRNLSLIAATAMTVVIAVGSSLAGRDASAPEPVVPIPTPSENATPSPPSKEPNPFPTSMTPEQVVHEPRAQLGTVAVEPGNPDVRMSMWSYTCTRPCPEQGPFEFAGLALTTDGYSTTRYLRPPFPSGVDLQVTSPRDGLFLVIDQSNGGEWLVDAIGGTARPVTRVDQEIAPAEEGLWFQCHGHWRQTWCSLDPDTATAYEWPQVWDGSAVSPAGVDRPWGANPKPRSTSGSGRLEAWWDTDQGRQLRTLASVRQGDYILDSPPGVMGYWARPGGASTVDLYTSSDGGAHWQVDTREAPGFNDYLQMRRSPDGAFVACSIYPRLTVWRAEAAGGPFEQVYEESGASSAETSGAGLWADREGLLYATANARVAVSDDDGRTWTTIKTWR
jgi:hypothetical protein